MALICFHFRLQFSIDRITVHNKLSAKLSNVKVTFAQSSTPPSGWSRLFDWRTIDVESGVDMMFRKTVVFGDIGVDEQITADDSLHYAPCYTGYWQMSFDCDGVSHKINPSNARHCSSAQDNRKYVDIAVRYQGDGIRLDFVMESGIVSFDTIST